MPVISRPRALRRSTIAVRRRTPRSLVGALLGVTLAVGGCSSAADEGPVTVTTVIAPTSLSETTVTRSPAATSPSGDTSPEDTPSPDTTTETTPSPDTSPEDTPSPDTSTETTTEDTTEAGNSEPTSPGAEVPTANAPDASPDTAGPETGPACATNSEYVDEQPTGLRSDVITGWRSIERAANADGVIVCLNDGKRSRAQQQAQYDQYEEQYGTEVADQLVLPPSKSAHVIGNAIDVQPQAAYQWVQATTGSLGFCRIYDNEPWHFEYDVAYFTDGCPARLPKPQR